MRYKSTRKIDDEQWRQSLLVTITARHAAEWRQRETRDKRGGGDVRGHSALASPEDSSAGDPFDRIAGTAPEPGFEAAVAESCRRLLDLLGDEQLRRIAVWKMEGHTNQPGDRRSARLRRRDGGTAAASHPLPLAAREGGVTGE